jgi:hypothetical protein
MEQVLTKVITKSVSKTGITNALEGRDYERLWAEDENEDGDSDRCQTAVPRMILYKATVSSPIHN